MATMKNKKNILDYFSCPILFGTLLLLFASAAFPQDKKISYSIPYIESAPSIDGKISEGEWAGANIVYLNNETEPSQNVPAIVNTEVFMMEDGSNFYLAFNAYDPEPEKIRAFFSDRDTGCDDDRVGLLLIPLTMKNIHFSFFQTLLCSNEIVYPVKWAVWEGRLPCLVAACHGMRSGILQARLQKKGIQWK
jgi:hypothetical protein